RAKYIAETFFDEARQVTNVRNMAGFTGSYQGMPVSVMGTGMGVPSASIYITELIRFYEVKRLIRVGSTGAIPDEVGLRDVVIAIGASTDSGVNRARYNGMDYSPTADFSLLEAAVNAARAQGATFHVGNVHTSDSFYGPDPEKMFAAWERMGVLAVEMETAGLYAIAAEERVKALSILTVSDHIKQQTETTSDERERTFNDMVEIALTALKSEAAS
ncbi:MAG TPA: purine-nucleoside phosphorylase, partial [Actinobacteria bacterium]|nr:purine-nucleoside phosphorylase [Actinomycetota bacterium]